MAWYEFWNWHNEPWKETWHGGDGNDSFDNNGKWTQIAVYGGGGNDQLHSGTTTEKAYLYGGGGNDRITVGNRAVTHFETWGGDGDDYIEAAGVNVKIHSEHGNDYYRIHSGANIDVWLGSGNKTIRTGALLDIDIHESAGGSGDRRDIEIGSASDANITTGYGDDRIYGLGVFRMNVTSWGGNNRISVQGADSDVWTGSGNDHITVGGVDTQVHAGGGDNRIDAQGAGVKVWAGNGNDTLNVDALIGGAWLGDGDNTVNYAAAASNIHVGSGDDRINVRAVGVAIDAGAGDNHFDIRSAGARLTAGNGDDYAYVGTGVGLLDLGHGDNTVDFHAVGGDVRVGSGDDRINVRAVGVTIDAGHGDNHFDIRSAGARLTAGNGDDYAYVGAGVGLLDLGHGDNTVDFHAVGGDVRVGRGDDQIDVHAVGVTIDAGGGDNKFNVLAAGARLTAGNGDDYAYVGAAVGLLDLRGGANTVELAAVGGEINVGNGDDTLVVGALGADLDAGGGDNIIIAKTFGVSVEAGGGNDRIESLGVGGQEIDSGNGNDSIHAAGGVNVVHAGHGHNEISAKGGLNVVQAGHGDNVIEARGGANTVLSGHGNNSIEARGGGNFVFAGNGDNDLTAGGALNIVLAGDGKNTVYAAGGFNIVMTGNGGTAANSQRQLPVPGEKGANLVENGSFELGIGDLNLDGAYARVPDGWHAAQANGPDLLLTEAREGVGPAHGLSYLELDRSTDAAIYQDVQTRGGQAYEISLKYAAPGEGIGTDTGDVDLYWDGELVATLSSGEARRVPTSSRDVYGSAGADVFVVTEQGLKDRVFIREFEDGVDKIDLRGVGIESMEDFTWIDKVKRSNISTDGKGNYVDFTYLESPDGSFLIYEDGSSTGKNFLDASDFIFAEPDAVPADGQDWQTHRFVVYGAEEADVSRLEVRAAGQSDGDGIGGLVDDVRVQKLIGVAPETLDPSHGSVLRGTAFFLDETPTSLKHAQKLMLTSGTAEQATYTVDRLDFVERSSTGGNLDDFLGDSASLLTGDGQRTHDNVVHRITGQIYLTEGEHSLTFKHDNGLRVRIGGEKVLGTSKQSQGTPATRRFTAVEDGYYDVEILYFDKWNTGKLSVELDGAVLDVDDLGAPVTAGNEIRAYGVGNFVVSGDGSDLIRAGSLLAIATEELLELAEDSDDPVVQDVFGNDDGSFGEDTLVEHMTNMLSVLGNLGNVILAGNGDNVVKAYGGGNLVQTGSGNDYIVGFGLNNLIVAGNGRNKVQVIGNTNVVWGGSGDDEVHFIGADNLFLLGDGYNRVTGIGYPSGGNTIGNVIVGAGGIDDVVASGAWNVLLLGGGDNFAIALGTINIVQGGSGNDTFFTAGLGNGIVAGDGDNFVTAVGKGNLVLAGSGDDFALLLGKGNIALLGDGDNDVISGGLLNVVVTGTGNDLVTSIGQFNIVSTASGIDTVVAGGQYNVVLSGGHDDVVVLAGQYNFGLTGYGDDIVVAAGEYNFLLSEAGDDTLLALGKDNYVLTGSGHDRVFAIGQQNVVASGTGSDIVVMFGERNIAATDNEINFNLDELNRYVDKYKSEDSDAGTSVTAGATSANVSAKNDELGVAVSGGITAVGEFAVLFPDIEFSSEDVPDWSFPTWTLKQYDLEIPDIPELKSAPDYRYGELGNYGLPTISLPTISTPELQVPGQTLPSFTLPDFSAFDWRNDGFYLDFSLDINLTPSFFGEFDALFSDLSGQEHGQGSTNQVFGSFSSVRPNLTDAGAGLQTYSENSVDVGPADATSNNYLETQDLSNSDDYLIWAEGGYGTVGQHGNFEYLNVAAIDNASFEEGIVFFLEDNRTLANPPDWTVDADFGASAVEIVRGGQHGAIAAADGGNVLELDVEVDGVVSNAAVYQDVATEAGQRYSLSLDYSPQDIAQGSETNSVEVWWNDRKVGTLSADSTGWTTHTFTVEGAAQTDRTRLELRGAGAADGIGGWVDNLSLEAAEAESPAPSQPEPASATAPASANVSVIELPTFSLPELTVPDFRLNGLDLTNLDALESTIAGREFFGLQVPSFEIPEEYLHVPDFQLSDYAEREQLTLPAQSFTIPALEIPNVAGIVWEDRLPQLAQTYSLLQQNEDGGDGDVAILAGKENRLYTGGGDDGALVLGQENLAYTGQGDDIILVAGETNSLYLNDGADIAVAIGKTNSLWGGADNDVLLAIGQENTLRGGQADTDSESSGDDDNVFVAIGEKNTIFASDFAVDLTGGNDVALAIGKENKVVTGAGDDSVVSIGVKNKTGAGAGDDIVVSIGYENNINLGKGSDLAISLGYDNRIIGDDALYDNSHDIVFSLGLKNRIEGNGGNDSVFSAGVYNTNLVGGGDDLLVTAGVRNLSSLGDGDDVGVNFGLASLLTGGAGDDFIINVGTAFAAMGNQGDDLFLNVGYGVTTGDDGSDTFLNFGFGTLDVFARAGLDSINRAVADFVEGFNYVADFFGSDGVTALSQVFSIADQQILFGGAGDDIFFAGFGNSIAMGELGADRYVYTLGSGHFVVDEQPDQALAATLGDDSTTAEGLDDALATDGGSVDSYFDDLSAPGTGEPGADASIPDAGGAADSGSGDLDILEIRTNPAQAGLQLDRANIVLANDNSQIDVVVDGASLGQVTLGLWEDSDLIRVVDSDSTMEFSFSELKAYWAERDAESYTAFDPLAAIETGVAETLDWLKSGESGAGAAEASPSRQIADGALSVVAEVHQDFVDAKAGIDRAVSDLAGGGTMAASSVGNDDVAVAA